MANFNEIGLDLQGVLKRTYANLLYESSFYKFLNMFYIGDVRNVGLPRIELIKQKPTTINERQTVEIPAAGISGVELATYDQEIVDLTELRMDYSFKIPVLAVGSNIAGAIDEQIRLNDSEMSFKIDTYGFNKMATGVTNTVVWAPATQNDYISLLNTLKSTLFNAKVYDTYRLGLEAIEYGNLVAALTSILKFETEVGVKGVDMGVVAEAYGIEIFPINSNVLTNSELGYFASPVAVVGDTFFTDMVTYNGNYPKHPGYFVIERKCIIWSKSCKTRSSNKISSTGFDII